MPDASLAELTALALKFRDDRDWKQFHNPKDSAVSLSLEVGELLEIMQWRNGPALEQHLQERREHVGQELADVLFWVLVIAHDQQIDLADAFRAKQVHNATKYPVEKARGLAKKYTQL